MNPKVGRRMRAFSKNDVTLYLYDFKFDFKPVSNSISKKPKYQDTICHGLNLGPLFNKELDKKSINIKTWGFKN